MEMKKAWIWILIIVVVIVLGYLGRNKIRALYSGAYGSASLPSYTTTSPTVPTATGSIITTKSGTKGSYLVGSNGMTLYVFDNDTKGVSTCSGSCAGIWPAYTTSTVPAKLPTGVTTAAATNGSMQFVYKGRPLYYYSGDVQVGDMNGDGIGGIWHIAKP
jgi:predicted lipoprotein with Yx(FWY)xxD motif